MNENGPDFISAERAFLTTPERGLATAVKFLSDPKTFITNTLDEYEGEGSVSRINYLVESISDVIDVLTIEDVANINDLDILEIRQHGPSATAAEAPLFRLFKRAGVPFVDVEAWARLLPSLEDSPEGKLQNRGTMARLRQVYRE